MRDICAQPHTNTPHQCRSIPYPLPTPTLVVSTQANMCLHVSLVCTPQTICNQPSHIGASRRRQYIYIYIYSRRQVQLTFTTYAALALESSFFAIGEPGWTSRTSGKPPGPRSTRNGSGANPARGAHRAAQATARGVRPARDAGRRASVAAQCENYGSNFTAVIPRRENYDRENMHYEKTMKIMKNIKKL